MPSFDQYNNFRGTYLGADRLPSTTPSPDASEALQPYLPVSYPAPWLPIKRRDESHPIAAGIVISEGHLVGVDKSGALIPAGYFSGQTAAKASGGDYSVVVYSQYDVGVVTNPQTGLPVQVAGEHVVLAAPSDAAAGDTVTLPNGTVVTISAGDITFAHACDLIPGGTSRALGYSIVNVFTNLLGIQISSLVGGIAYIILSQRPDLMQITNYAHSMGTAIRTHFVLRMPWIGATPNTLQLLANADGVANYTQTDFSRSFVHFTGTKGNAPGDLFLGCSVVPSNAGHGTDAGNYAPYNPAVNNADDIVGKVLGVELMYPIRDYADRVRTQFERASEFVGPRMDPNPVTFQMGGSATKGLDYAITLGTNGLYPLAVRQNKPVNHGEYYTYVIIHVNCR